MDIAKLYGPMSHMEMYKSCWMVVDALNGEFHGEWHLPVPNTEPGTPQWNTDIAALRDLEIRFRTLHSPHIWTGQVGAVDGCIIRMSAPTNSTVDPLRYYCARKSTFALLLMAIADADRRFVWHDISFTPSTHDSSAWSGTAMGARINAGKLPYPFFISGDNAFSQSNSMMTPGGTDSYDWVQSLMRMPVECAFGILYVGCIYHGGWFIQKWPHKIDCYSSFHRDFIQQP